MLRNFVLHLHFTKSLENYREMKTFWKVTDSGFYPTIRSVAEMRKFQEFAYPDVSVAIHKLLLTQCQDMKFYICLTYSALKLNNLVTNQDNLTGLKLNGIFLKLSDDVV